VSSVEELTQESITYAGLKLDTWAAYLWANCELDVVVGGPKKIWRVGAARAVAGPAAQPRLMGGTAPGWTVVYMYLCTCVVCVPCIRIVHLKVYSLRFFNI
jgi:hypothetical protein